jgi:dipeptidase E
MSVDLINLEDLNGQNIIGTFEPYNVIYVYGGNTFYLMHYANISGFKKNIDKIIENKIYVGVSAGTIIACSDITPAGWEGHDQNYIGLEDMSGMNLIPYVIMPHWNDQIPKEAETYDLEIKYIKDGEAIIVSYPEAPPKQAPKASLE